MAPQPILSIVIPAYNASRYCAACFDSILRNDSGADRFEVVVVDDGSMDATPDIAQVYSLVHEPFRCIRQDNSGVSVARKNGCREARGQYIWFVDSDDYLEDRAVDRMLATIAAHPDTDTFIAPIKLRDEDTGREWIKDFAPAPEGTLRGKDYLRRRPVSVCPVQFVFRKQLFANPWVRFPEGVRHEDEYFCRVLQYFSGTVTVLDEPLYVYRQWGGSFMNSASCRSMSDMVEVYRQLKSFIEERADAEDRDWLRADAFSFLMGTHFWHIDRLKSDGFQSFRRDNIGFLLQEFDENKRLLPRKDRLLGSLILNCPGLFADLMKIKNLLKGRKKTA
ncbi:MAG: glycosyltransferase family 2 protein [Bacteroidales bacterium]|nr:glycosyltransferase family 2 protein [Bacteroidales bacterium]